MGWAAHGLGQAQKLNLNGQGQAASEIHHIYRFSAVEDKDELSTV